MRDPAADSTPGYTPFGLLGSPFAVNDSGRIAYLALQESGNKVLVTIDTPAQPVTVIDTNVGSVRDLSTVSMNSAGDIVFMGATVLVSPNMGLYTGPNPATDVVVDAFDSLPGYDSPIEFLDFDHPGIHDAGQVVFKAHLQGGTEVIARAAPETPATTTTTTLPASRACWDPASLIVGVPGAGALDAVITASDALLGLMAATGQPVVLNCPSCG